ncbi:Heterokaryon incompatibility protein 6, OR allele [Pseudocercospora fuligena]|uniref:Heterokaryon incompatibility protein 6, OR allele n=1 Tax=Pseudocercospora fuligena TaxID=685502 RepID=A0A8H6RJU4_9PEZI|nr:Heterokaryon incompatibility protein 6, OR allele [Pseudocercospora fuligena]
MITRKPVPSITVKARPPLKPFVYDAPQQSLIREFQLDPLPDGEENRDAPLSGRIMSNTFAFLGIEGFTSAFIPSAREDTRSVRKKLSGSDGYVAVSYCWGIESELFPLHLVTVSCDLDKDDNVVVNHEPERNGYVWIRPNLRAFLLELRRRQERRFLWIDAICIDQADNNDKGHQIKHMKHVYDYAEEVYVWLGQASEMELGALRILPNVTANLQECESDAYENLEQAFAQVGLPDPTHDIWRAYSSIMTRSWWSRLWTLQEIVMASELDGAFEYKDLYKAPNAVVLCGGSTTMWEKFDHFVEALAKTGLKEWLITGEIGIACNDLHGIDAVSEVRTGRASQLRYGWAVTMSATLLATRRRQATMPADMVFGQLALLDNATIKELALDISMPETEVFTRFSKHYVRNEVKECLLNHTATVEKLTGLPSWCPNFASREETISIGSRWVGHYQEQAWLKKQMPCAGLQKHGKWKLPRSKLYYAKYITNALQAKHGLDNQYNTNNPRQIALAPKTDCIIATGVELDVVAHIVECNPAAESAKFLSYNSIVQTRNWEQQCYKLAYDTFLTARTTASRSYYDLYARTLTANRVTMNPSDLLSRDEDASEIIFDRYQQIDFADPYLNFRKFMQASIDAGETIDPKANMTRETHRFATCLAAISKRRKFFSTRGGKIGIGPSDAQPGDLVVMIFYCPTPYLIRQSDTVPGQWHFVGEVFISGYMYGEVLEMFDRGEVKETKWTIG